MDHTEATISQRYYRPNIRDEILNHMRVFKTCQKNKKYGHIPANEAEAISWDILSVDLIVPYNI